MMGDSTRIKAAKARLERAAVAWAEGVNWERARLIDEVKSAARGLRDAIASEGKAS